MKSYAINVADATAIGVTVGTVAQILPSMAALFTIIWTGIRIFETKTMQRIFKRNKTKK